MDFPIVIIWKSQLSFLGGIKSAVSFLLNFSMKFLRVNRKAPDGTPRFAASHLGLFCLPMSHKKDVRLFWSNVRLWQHTFNDLALVR